MSEHKTDITFDGLDALRERLDAVDEALVRTIAERQALVSEIGRLKASHGHQTRDFKRERVVLDRARATATAAGVDAELAERVLTEMIRSSLEKQERDRVMASAAGDGRSALVIGGAGRMGKWFVEFFHSQGYAVSIADPAADTQQDRVFSDWQSAGVDYDIIVVATTLALSAKVLDELTKLRPDGLVFDVGSLKTPLRAALQRMAAADIRVTSIHPMFGPSTQLLAGKQVIFTDVGNAAATQQARDLFASTMATCIDMSIDAHDQIISYVLGLSHATNIAFADALRTSGMDADSITQVSSPTFDAQLGMGRTVIAENPHLYYEIQRLNDYGLDALRALAAAVNRLETAVAGDDEASFVAAMQNSRDFFDSEQ